MSAEDLADLPEAEIQARVAAIRLEMRPVEQALAGLRAERDLLLTELRRRERLATRERRLAARRAASSGEAVTVAELISTADSGAFDDYRYTLKTGGSVRLGFPGARSQTIGFTDGARIVQAADLAACAELYAAGWEPGGPGRPGVRVHFPGTRQEMLADPAEVFAKPSGPTRT